MQSFINFKTCDFANKFQQQKIIRILINSTNSSHLRYYNRENKNNNFFDINGVILEIYYYWILEI